MARPRTVQIIGLLLFVGLIGAAATRVSAINTGRKALSMYGHESPLENAPPGYAFAIQVFGAFRSLITDIAFIRAEEFKQQGRYYDAMQLAKWICALQPHFPAVWEFASWNMAWNISVTTFTAEERWNWVYNGVKLLRDQGIPLNPRAVNLYKQLAWTFNNKMGDALDEYHYAYKANWAWRMHLVLGPPPDPFAASAELAEVADKVESADQIDKLEQAARVTATMHEEERRERAELRGKEYVEQDRAPQETAAAPRQLAERSRIRQQAVVKYMRSIAGAAASLEELYERHPEARRMVAELRHLGVIIEDDELSEDTYWYSGGLAFTFFEPYRELRNPQTMLIAESSEDAPADPERARRERLGEIIGLEDEDPAGVALFRFLQRKVLSEVYKLEPDHMVYLTEAFGPLDWRAVDALSLYWTSRGLIAGGETLQDYTNDKTNTARILFFSLRNLFLFGQITFEPLPESIQNSYLSRSIDPAFIEPLQQAYVRLGRLFDPDTRGIGGAGDTFRSGHINFLTEIISTLYLSGFEDEARHYFEYLQDTYRTTLTGEPNPAMQKTLHDFVLDNILETAEVPGIREMVRIIMGMLTNAYTQLSRGDFERYTRLVRRAAAFHESYQRDRRGPEAIRTRLPEFADMQIDAFGQWLARPPLTRLETLAKARLWSAAPLFLRQHVYDILLPQFERECEHWGFDVARAFPEPRGMEEFREQRPDRFREGRDSEVENLPRGPGQ